MECVRGLGAGRPVQHQLLVGQRALDVHHLVHAAHRLEQHVPQRQLERDPLVLAAIGVFGPVEAPLRGREIHQAAHQLFLGDLADRRVEGGPERLRPLQRGEHHVAPRLPGLLDHPRQPLPQAGGRRGDDLPGEQEDLALIRLPGQRECAALLRGVEPLEEIRQRVAREISVEGHETSKATRRERNRLARFFLVSGRRGAKGLE